MSAQQQQVCAHCQVTGHSRAVCPQHLQVVGTNATQSLRGRPCAQCLGDPRRRVVAAAPPPPPPPPVTPLANNGQELTRLRAEVASLRARPQGRDGHFRTFVHFFRCPAAASETADGAIENFVLNTTTLTAATTIAGEYQTVTVASVRLELIAVGQESTSGIVVCAVARSNAPAATVNNIIGSPYFVSVHRSRGSSVFDVPDFTTLGISRHLDEARRPTGSPGLRISACQLAGNNHTERSIVRIVVTLLLRGSTNV